MDKYILYQTEYNEKKKNVALSVVLGIFFGILGLLYTSGSAFLVMLMCFLGSLFFLFALVGPVSFSILVPFVVFFFYILSIYLCYSKAESHNKELIKTLKKKYFIEREGDQDQMELEIDPKIRPLLPNSTCFCIFLVVIVLMYLWSLFY